MTKGNKIGWICTAVGAVLLGAAAAFGRPLLKGPGSVRAVLDEKARTDSAGATLAEIADSLAGYTRIDSLTFVNLYGDEIAKKDLKDPEKQQ